MNTRERTLTTGNVDQAADIIRRALFMPALNGCDPVEVSRTLLDAGSMMGVLVDLVGPDGSSRVIGVGGGAFVANRIVAEARAQPRPGLPEQVLGAQLTSNPAVLTRREIENANAGEGLSLVVLFHDWIDLSEELELEVRHHLMAAFLRDLKGLNVIEVLAEAREAELGWIHVGGFQVRSDYGDWYAARRDPQPRRVLIGLTRHEAAAAQGTVISLAFDYTPPRFGFTASQRKLLSQALQHKTDAEIASALGVSLSAVKKTWAAIFDKVSGYFPEIGENLPEVRSSPSTTRGAQKRHRLLTYIQKHPEEIKP